MTDKAMKQIAHVDMDAFFVLLVIPSEVEGSAFSCG
jgi:hypothetical protein